MTAGDQQGGNGGNSGRVGTATGGSAKGGNSGSCIGNCRNRQVPGTARAVMRPVGSVPYAAVFES